MLSDATPITPPQFFFSRPRVRFRRLPMSLAKAALITSLKRGSLKSPSCLGEGSYVWSARLEEGSPQGDLFHKEITHSVGAVGRDQRVRFQYVSQRFAHLHTVLCQKPVAEHLLRNRQTSRHQHRRPIHLQAQLPISFLWRRHLTHRMESQNVFADEMHPCRPPHRLSPLQRRLLALWKHSRYVACHRGMNTLCEKE